MFSKSDLEMNERLLTDAEEFLKARTDREAHVLTTVNDFKRRVVTEMEEGRWDAASNTILEAKSLDGQRTSAKADKEGAQARVNNLKEVIARLKAEQEAFEGRSNPKPNPKPKKDKKGKAKAKAAAAAKS